MWDRFLKYDLCITDYDSLTDEEKELCRFIFEIERSADNTVRCTHARHILEGNTVNCNRMTLDGVLDNQRYIDPINPEYSVIDLYISDYVSDISHLDYDACINEYWLDNSGSERILCYNQEGMILQYVCFEANDSDNELSQRTLSDGNKVYHKNLELPEKTDKGIIEQDGNYYVITREDTATLIRSSTANGEKIDDSLKTMVIPDKINGSPVTKINSEAFKDSTVTNIILPDTLTHIGNNAFYNCQYLENINILESLEYLGDAAFMQCYNLSEIRINCPELFIGDYAFYCVGLKSAELNVKSVGYRSFWSFDLTELTFDDNLMQLKAEAFCKCASLKDVQLPSRLQSIGQSAFSMTNVKHVTIPVNVNVISSLPTAYGSTMTDIKGEVPASDPLTASDLLILDETCIINGWYGSEAHYYALANSLQFNSLDDLLYGDANGDGSINVADAVLLQNYLLRNVYVGYEADLNKDGRIDVFDMIAMRKTLMDKL